MPRTQKTAAQKKGMIITAATPNPGFVPPNISETSVEKNASIEPQIVPVIKPSANDNMPQVFIADNMLILLNFQVASIAISLFMGCMLSGFDKYRYNVLYIQMIKISNVLEERVRSKAEGKNYEYTILNAQL